ncbi:hypothetical protein [Microbacterium sp. 179-I 3D3 NHS]|uniref:hypothetical protein n=1 Tax=Microbacterium sp. 179-I 3D3 NHS TaxID=3142382 RepID=UPI0039A03E42
MPVIRRRKPGGSFGLAGLGLLLAAIAVGCSAAAVEEDAGAKDRATWKMPLSEFHVYSVELDNYAEQLLIANCLTSQGHKWPVPWQDTEYPHPEDFNKLGVRLFNLQIAKKWGYHFARLENEESALLWSEFVSTTNAYFPNQELDDALQSCSDEVRSRDEDPFVNFDGQNYISELYTQAQKVVEQDEAVQNATQAWRECLAPQVDFTLPRDPWTEMPPSSVAQEWGAITGGTPEPSVEEIAAAVADAKCRESSDLAAITYEKNWEEQQKLVAENRDKLERIRAEAVERKKMLLTIVAENAPEAP